MAWKLTKIIIALPGTVVVFIPTAILLLTRDSKFHPELASPAQVGFWLGCLIRCLGLSLSIWTVTLFTRFGEGTPAPWDPPKKLVIRGPYRHVRNPMISGVLLMLSSEAMLFQSWPIGIWMMIIFVGNAIYFPLFEEKALEKRFGDSYRRYKSFVPRWIPRLRPWNPSVGNEQKGC